MNKRKIFYISFLSLFIVACAPNGEKPQEIKQLVVSHKPDKISYDVGESFISEGLRVIDLNGKPVSEFTSSIDDGYVFNEEGKFTITLSKEGYVSTQYKVDVLAYHSIFIKTEPIKLEFFENELMDTSGLTLFDENRNEIDPKTCNFTYKNGYRLLESPGTYMNVISKEGYKSASYAFKINTLNDSIYVSSLPSVLTYTQGDYFDASGLVVVDKLGNIVTDYTLSPEDGVQLKTTGSITVNVTKKNFTGDSFTITVEESSKPKENNYIDFYYLNDTHGSFYRMNSYKEPGMGLIATYLKDKKQEAPNNTFILSGGDMLQGGYESIETKGQIMIDAMEEIGFDAMACGNHEFDWGANTLESIAGKFSDAGIPLLSCNTFYSYLGKNPNKKVSYLSDFVVIERGGVKVGIIGSIQAGIGSSIDSDVSDLFSFRDPINYVKACSDNLRLNYACDVVILLTHDEGYDSASEEAPYKFEELTEPSPSTNTRYVDAMFFAHDHYVKTGKYNGVSYLEAGSNGQNIGKLTINLKGNNDGYTVASSEASYIDAYNTLKYEEEDPGITRLINEKYKTIVTNGNQVICTISKYYSKYSFTEIVCQAMVWFVNTYSDEYFDGSYVYLGCHNTGGVRTSVYAGDFTIRNLVKVCPFDNDLCITESNETQYNYMVNSSFYKTYKNGEPAYYNGHTSCVTITYISISYYSRYVQDDYTRYNFTAKQALKEFLIAGEVQV